MKKTLQIIILCLLAVFFLRIGLAYSATVEADSCSQADVQAAIDEANSGDTVTIPAGSCTWSTNYQHADATTIYYGVKTTKAIKIQGAGIGTTNITSNLGTTSGTYYGRWLFIYVPSSPSDDADVEMSISGFTFDDALGTSRHGGVFAVFNRSTTAVNKVMVYNNSFLNCYGGEASSTGYTSTLMFQGTIYGVVYSNTFNSLPYFVIEGYPYSDGGSTTWKNKTWSPGSQKAMYFEDNTINKNTDGDSPHQIWSSGWGATYVVRFNDIINSYDTLSMWNMHSIQRGGTPSSPTWMTLATMGAEFYGNDITNTGNSTFAWNQGGGRLMAFYNYVNDGSGRTVQGIISDVISDEYGIGVATTPLNTCTDTLYSVQPAACNPDHERQRITKSYYFKNIKSSTSGAWTLNKLNYAAWDEWGGNKLVERVHYWTDTNITCSSSIPSGSCASGSGHWKTDQSCSDLTGLVGVDPATPLSGTFYRCYPSNVWSVYYIPLAYPHPLRDDAPEDTEAPSMSQPCAGSGPCTYPIVQIACDDLDDTEDIVIGLTATDQQAAITCKADLDDVAYADMADVSFTQSGTSQTATVSSLACAQQHTYYARCTDGTTANSSSLTIQFVIAGRGDDTAAQITSATTAQQACSVQQKISISTDKPSTCKWSLTDEAYADMDYTFSVTGGETGHVAHSTDVSQDCSESVTRYIRCSTTQGVANSSSTAVTITTDGAKSISIGAGSMTLGIGSGTNQITILP